MTDLKINNGSWSQNGHDLELVQGRVVDGAIPPTLVAELAALAGSGSGSGRTGINNHVENTFEGWTGTGWTPAYFNRAAAAQHAAVEAWTALARRLVADVVGVHTVEPAHSQDGHAFTPAVVRETMNGIDWHFDAAHLEYPGTELDLGPDSQHWSVITYLNTPQNGELEVAAWKPADAGAHPKESYPLDERLFASAERIKVQPVAGRTAIMSSEYAHRVHPTPTPRRFVTMFVAVGANGQAISFG
ncbi:hypothetical protein ACIF9R_37665 [Streptomyces sp. NPDC086080]|uniref:hypothetical protein n=1 Tax=Streptomyces sp. NPDC086080 TaxID=3365748 RepID=UPI0037CFC132